MPGFPRSNKSQFLTRFHPNFELDLPIPIRHIRFAGISGRSADKQIVIAGNEQAAERMPQIVKPETLSWF